jgi:hypothetical protein
MAAGVLSGGIRAGGMEESLETARRVKPVVEAHGLTYVISQCISGGPLTDMMFIGMWSESLTSLGTKLDTLGKDPNWLSIRKDLQNSPLRQTIGTRVMTDIPGLEASIPDFSPGTVYSATTYVPAPNQMTTLTKYFADSVELLGQSGFQARVRRALYSGASPSYQITVFYQGGLAEVLGNWESSILTDPQWQALVQRNREAGIQQTSQLLARILSV